MCAILKVCFTATKCCIVGTTRLSDTCFNLVDEDETKDTPKRFVKSFEKVEDIFSTEETEFAVEGLNLTIRFDFEQNDDYITCPIGVIEKNETGAFVWAKNYTPPLLSITGSETFILLS